MSRAPSSIASIVGLFSGLILMVSGLGSARAQTAPAYPELFENPPEVASLTERDLPNLSRMLVLESISMSVYIQRESPDSPDGRLLLDQIRALWNASDEFNQLVASAPIGSSDAEEVSQAFLGLETAVDQLRSTLGSLPGIAPRTAERLERVERILTPMRLLIGGSRTGVAIGMAPGQRARDLARLRQELQIVKDEVSQLMGSLRNANGTPANRTGLFRELDSLLLLIQGVDRLLEGRPADVDVERMFRPVRARAQRINSEILTAGTPVVDRNRWRGIQTRIDQVAGIFGLPRQIVLIRAQVPAREVDFEAVSRLDQAIGAVEKVSGGVEAGLGAVPERALILADASRLRTQLLMLRQEVAAEENSLRIRRAFEECERLGRQIITRVDRHPEAWSTSERSVIRDIGPLLEGIGQRLDMGH